MGTYIGHVMPGTIFGFLGIWLTFSVFFQYYKSRLQNKQFRSRVYYPLISKRIPFQSFIGLISAISGIITELLVSVYIVGMENDHNLYHHITMYTFFLVQAIAEILHAYHFKLIPADASYATLALTFFIEAFLFFYHTHHNSELELLVHRHLVLAALCCCAATLVEYFVRNNVTVALVRPYFILVQSTWFYQIAFVLFGDFVGYEHWDGNDDKNLMLANLYFTWHCLFNIGVVFVTAMFVKYTFKWSSLLTGDYWQVNEKLLNVNGKSGKLQSPSETSLFLDYSENDDNDFDCEI